MQIFPFSLRQISIRAPLNEIIKVKMTTPLKPPIIRQVTFHLENSQIYSFDVNATITFHYLKRMIAFAAKIPKVDFRITHNNQDYTELNYEPLNEFFPEEQNIPFKLIITQPLPDMSESVVKLRLKKYCPLHSFKYLSYYCYTCKKSICSSCFIEDNHSSHNAIEKYDYLQSSKHLVDVAFESTLVKADVSKAGNVSNAELLQHKVKNIHFKALHALLNDIELKFTALIGLFSENSQNAMSVIKKNNLAIKDYCSAALDKLKEEIGIEKIMLDEEVFLTYDKKVKELSAVRAKLLSHSRMFTEYSNHYQAIELFCEKVCNSLNSALSSQLSLQEFTDIQRKVSKESVALITKDEVMNKMLEDVEGKSYRRNSLLNASKLYYSNDQSALTSANNKSSISAIGDSTSYVKPSPLNRCTLFANQDEVSPHKPSNEGKGFEVIFQPIPSTKTLVMCSRDFDTEQISVTFPPLTGLTLYPDKAAHCNLNGHLYVSGGLAPNGEPSKAFFKYDSSNKAITLMPSMEEARLNHTLLEKDGLIYAVGGCKTLSVEVFSLLTNKWERISSLNKKRQRPMLFIHEAYLYAFGGFNKQGFEETIERINLRVPKGKWELVPFLYEEGHQLRLYSSGLACSDGILFFFGGKNAKGVLDTVYSYDFSSNTFSLCEDKISDKVHFIENTLFQSDEGYFVNIDEGSRTTFSFKISDDESVTMN